MFFCFEILWIQFYIFLLILCRWWPVTRESLLNLYIYSFKRQSAYPFIYPSQRHLYCRCLVYCTCLKIRKGVVVFRRCKSKDRHYNGQNKKRQKLNQWSTKQYGKKIKQSSANPTVIRCSGRVMRFCSTWCTGHVNGRTTSSLPNMEIVLDTCIGK
jgi:hypothetical protein